MFCQHSLPQKPSSDQDSNDSYLIFSLRPTFEPYTNIPIPVQLMPSPHRYHLTFHVLCIHPVLRSSSEMRSDLWLCHGSLASPPGLSPCQRTVTWRTTHYILSQRSLQDASMLRHKVNEEARSFWQGTEVVLTVSMSQLWVSADSISGLIMPQQPVRLYSPALTVLMDFSLHNLQLHLF